MRILLHLTLAELRRLRWWTLGWAVLQVPGLVMLWSGDDTPGSDLSYRFTMLQAQLAFAWAYLLTHEVWVEAAPLGPERFWKPRPISLAQLLGSRALALLTLLWLIPVLVSIPFWCFWGLTVADWGRALLSHATAGAGGFLGGLAVAVLNPWIRRGITRYLASLLCLACVGILAGFFSYARYEWAGYRDSPFNEDGRLSLLVGAWALVVLVSVGLLYLTRKRWLSSLVLGIFGAGACACYLFLPIPAPLLTPSPAAESALGRLEGFQFSRRPGEREYLQVDAQRRDPAGIPLELRADQLLLEQGELRIPVFCYLRTPTQKGGDINDVPNFVPDASALRGAVRVAAPTRVEGWLLAQDPLSSLDPAKPLRLTGVAQLSRYSEDEVILIDLPRSYEGKVLRRQSGPWSISVRQIRGDLFVSASTRPRLASARVPATARLRFMDGSHVQVSRGTHSSGSRSFTALGVVWHVEQVDLRDPRCQTTSKLTDPKVRLRVGHEHGVGAVRVDAVIPGITMLDTLGEGSASK